MWQASCRRSDAGQGAAGATFTINKGFLKGQPADDAGVALGLTRMMCFGPVGLESSMQGNEESVLTAFRNAFTV
jgi:hypothetical protein